MKTKRPGCRENGEIDTRDAYQIEIFCSWPQLFQAPNEIAQQVNQDGGYLRISEPGMSATDWAHRVNEYKRLGLIPGPIRHRDLLWDGQDITRLIDKLCRIQVHGTPDLVFLPGYDPQQPGLLTCDLAGFCLADKNLYGRMMGTALTIGVVHIDNVRTLEKVSLLHGRRAPLTPAVVARQGVQVIGRENLPEKTILSKGVPDNGFCRISTHCLFCGTPIKVRGLLRNGKPHYEIDTQPTCNHLRLRMEPTPDGDHHELLVIHQQQFKSLGGTEATERPEAGRDVSG